MITQTRKPPLSGRVAAGIITLVLLALTSQLDRPAVASPLQAEELRAAAPAEVVEEVALLPDGEEPARIAPDIAPRRAAVGERSDTIPPPPTRDNPGQRIDTPARMLNVAEVQQNLAGFYPPLLREAGITGTAELQLYVGPEGSVMQSRVARTSGHPALDLAAGRVAGTIRFSPFKFRGENVGGWLTMPFTFGGNGPAANAPGAGADAGPGRALAAGVPPFPGAFPVTELSRPPALANMAEVQRALISYYPAELRGAGISGTVTMRIYIGADGTVLEGYPVSATNNGFTEAAEGIVRLMHFSPAENDGRQVPVWIELPINFQAG